LPFYAILRSIPNKLLGVIAMFSAIIILLAMPLTDLSRSRGIQFRSLSKIAFFIFIGNFLILMQLGAKHVESPFIEFGQISTAIYFVHFLIITPLVCLFENSLTELVLELSSNKYGTIPISKIKVEEEEKAEEIKPFAFVTLPVQSSLIGFNHLIVIKIFAFILLLLSLTLVLKKVYKANKLMKVINDFFTWKNIYRILLGFLFT
jgi:uncharacterized membrane protein